MNEEEGKMEGEKKYDKKEQRGEEEDGRKSREEEKREKQELEWFRYIVSNSS